MTIKPIGGIDMAQVKAAIAQATSMPITMKELQGSALAGVRRSVHKVRMFGQGTPAKYKNHGGRKRMVLADGRHMHPTKGIGKSERGGYAKRSRRSNTSRA